MKKKNPAIYAKSKHQIPNASMLFRVLNQESIPPKKKENSNPKCQVILPYLSIIFHPLNFARLRIMFCWFHLLPTRAHGRQSIIDVLIDLWVAIVCLVSIADALVVLLGGGDNLLCEALEASWFLLDLSRVGGGATRLEWVGLGGGLGGGWDGVWSRHFDLCCWWWGEDWGWYSD